MQVYDNRRDSGSFLNGLVSKPTRKTVGWTLIILGILLAVPPVIPSPDDFLNVFLATRLVEFGLSIDLALIATYTIIPFTLFTLGIWVFPAKDGTIYKKAKLTFLRMLKGYWKRIQNPVVFLTSAAIIWFIYNYYMALFVQTGMI